MVLRVLGLGHQLEQLGTVIQTGVYLAAQAQPRLPAGLLEDELDHGVGHACVLPPGPGVVHYVVVTALGEGEPGGHLIRPGDDLPVPGLQACLVRGLPGGLGLLPLAEVVVHAAEQQRQPADGDQQLAVLGQGEPPVQQPGHVAEPLLGARPQLGGGGAGVGAAQQLGRLLERVERPLAEVGDGDHARQVQGVDELGLAAERFGRVDAGRWHRRLPVRDESELGRIQAGHILQRAPVNG